MQSKRSIDFVVMMTMTVTAVLLVTVVGLTVAGHPVPTCLPILLSVCIGFYLGQARAVPLDEKQTRALMENSRRLGQVADTSVELKHAVENGPLTAAHAQTAATNAATAALDRSTASMDRGYHRGTTTIITDALNTVSVQDNTASTDRNTEARAREAQRIEEDKDTNG